MQGPMTNARDEEALSLEASGCLTMKHTHTHTHPNKTPLRSSLWLSWILGQLRTVLPLCSRVHRMGAVTLCPAGGGI